MTIVILNNVTKQYRLGKITVPAVRGVSLRVEAGGFIALCGPSGSGKTSLLNIIGCLDKPTTGDVHVLGNDVLSMGDTKLSELRSRSIGFIFQTFNLIPVLTAYENIEYPLLLMGVGSRERRERVMNILCRVGSKDHARHRPSELSGGQQQRVAIARALVTHPKLVLADEPTANLDTETGTQIIQLMRDLRDELGCTFLFSTHDLRVLRYVDKVYRMEDGRITLEGTSDDMVPLSTRNT